MVSPINESQLQYEFHFLEWLKSICKAKSSFLVSYLENHNFQDFKRILQKIKNNSQYTKEKISHVLDSYKEVNSDKEFLRLLPKIRKILSEQIEFCQHNQETWDQGGKIKELMKLVHKEAKLLIPKTTELENIEKNIYGLKTVRTLVNELILELREGNKINEINKIRRDRKDIVMDIYAKRKISGERREFVANEISREIEIFEIIRTDLPKIKRVRSILKKANIRSNGVNIIDILQYASKERRYKNLISLLNQESEYLRKGSYSRFLRAYKKECKIIFGYNQKLKTKRGKIDIEKGIELRINIGKRVKKLGRNAALGIVTLITLWTAPMVPVNNNVMSLREINGLVKENEFLNGLSQKKHSEETMKNASKLEIIGHRGMGEGVLGNTREAFVKSLRMGATTVECDIRLTKDNIPVIMHNETIDSVTNGHGKVSEMTFLQLQDIFMKNGEKGVPSFEEVARIVTENGGKLLMDIRYEDNMQRNQAINKAILDIINRLGIKNRVIASSFEIDNIPIFANSGVEVNAIFWSTDKELPGRLEESIQSHTTNYNIIEYIEKAKAIGATSINLPHNLINAESIEMIHKSGLKVNVYYHPMFDFFNKVKLNRNAAKMIEMGVDGIITDSPLRIWGIRNMILKSANNAN